jgi:hypothetical protein
MTRTEPRSLARAAGLAYFGYFIAAIAGLILINRKEESGVAVYCLADVLYALTTLFFYRLFRPVNGVLALIASAFSLLGCTADVLGQINHTPPWLSPLLFFGPFCALLGVLILLSGFLPRWLGWCLIVAGVAWLAFLIPIVARYAKAIILPLGFLAELALMLWLLIRGVDETRWAAKELARSP